MMPELIQNIDETVLVWIAEHLRCGVLDPVMKFYTQLGNSGLLFIGIALVLLCFRQTRKAGAAALCAMLLGLVAVNMTIKPLVSRTRPWLVIEGFVSLVPEHDPNSFPSGHTNAAFAFAAALCAVLPDCRKKRFFPENGKEDSVKETQEGCLSRPINGFFERSLFKKAALGVSKNSFRYAECAALCAAALMGFSRLYVGVHFPSDVLAGAAIGTLCGLAGAWTVKKAWERLNRRFPKAQG